MDTERAVFPMSQSLEKIHPMTIGEELYRAAGGTDWMRIYHLGIGELLHEQMRKDMLLIIYPGQWQGYDWQYI